MAGRARRRRRPHDPVRADAALRLPGQVRRVRRAVESAVLNRFCDAYRMTPACARSSRCRTSRMRSSASTPATRGRFDLPARRLPIRLRGQVPRVQRRLAGRHRVHRRPPRGPARGDRPAARRGGVRHLVHADASRPHRHAARCLPIAARLPSAAPRAPPPRARRPARQPVRAGVPDHLRCARRSGIEALRDHRRARYDGSALRVGGEPVELVYRRALIEDLEEGDLTAALRDGTVCVVNHPRARVANNKKLFALLDDPRSRTSSSRARPR